MTTIDPATEAPPAKRKPTRRKKARHPRRAAPDKTVAVPDELAGLTNVDCPVECSPKGCVISGKPYCGHPRKGGLQGAELVDPAALDRAQRAATALAHMAVDRRKA
jgi:hypothetical protein